MSEMTALQMMAKLLAVSVCWQTLELLKVQKAFSADGVWKWKIIRQDFPKNILLDFLMGNLIALLWIQFVCSVFILVLPAPTPTAAPVLFTMFGISFLISMRWRGAFNGGADSMTLISLLCLGVAMAGLHHPPIARGALWYVALQCVLSYFLSGFSKLRNAEWRNGKAFQDFLRLPQYGAPPWAVKLSGFPKFGFVGAWLTLIFELGAPLALFNSTAALLFIAGAFIFHLLNFWLIGLNRFFWAWLAAYPALYFCC